MLAATMISSPSSHCWAICPTSARRPLHPSGCFCRRGNRRRGGRHQSRHARRDLRLGAQRRGLPPESTRYANYSERPPRDRNERLSVGVNVGTAPVLAASPRSRSAMPPCGSLRPRRCLGFLAGELPRSLPRPAPRAGSAVPPGTLRWGPPRAPESPPSSGRPLSAMSFFVCRDGPRAVEGPGRHGAHGHVPLGRSRRSRAGVSRTDSGAASLLGSSCRRASHPRVARVENPSAASSA